MPSEITSSLGTDKCLITMGLSSISDNVFRNLPSHLLPGKWNIHFNDILESRRKNLA